MKCLRKVGKRGKVIKKNDDALRAAALERSGGLCEVCLNPPDFRGLQMHHIDPKGMGGTTRIYELTGVVACCGYCHSRFHGIQER